MSSSRTHRLIRRRIAVAAAACIGAMVPAAPALAQPVDGPITGPSHAIAAPVVVHHATPVTPSPDARDAALQASAQPISRTDPRSPDARDAALAATGQSPAAVPADLPTVVVHEHPSALPLALSIAALLIALAGWGFVVVRKTAASSPVPRLSH